VFIKHFLGVVVISSHFSLLLSRAKEKQLASRGNGSGGDGSL